MSLNFSIQILYLFTDENKKEKGRIIRKRSFLIYRTDMGFHDPSFSLSEKCFLDNAARFLQHIECSERNLYMNAESKTRPPNTPKPMISFVDDDAGKGLNNEGLIDGLDEGSHDGTAEGIRVGLRVGAAIGLRVGLVDGLTEGSVEGFTEGFVEGFVEGFAEGFAEGFTEGSVEGFVEGFAEGFAEGFVEGFAEGGAMEGLTVGQDDGSD